MSGAMLHRRGLLAGAACAGVAAAAHAQAQAPAPAPAPDLAAQLTRAAIDNRRRLAFDGRTFSGPALDLLLEEGGRAQFFLIGEEHGIAENPKLAAQLFRALVPAGYRRFGIEISPPMAAELDRAARGGFEPLRTTLTTPGSQVAFFGMAEEARMLADVRAALPRDAGVFWGLDYEVGADRTLIGLLEQAPKPPAARTALAALRQASSDSWAKYAETRNPQYIYGFSGDPDLVRAVRAAWPRPDGRSAWTLDVLEETFEINRLFFARRGWDSNRRRAALIRENFLRHWRAEAAAGRAPRAMFKMGSGHLIRGRSNTEVFDLGTLLPEAAALQGGSTFSMMVLPGAGAPTAVFDPARWTYGPRTPKDAYAAGLEPLTAAALPDAFTLIDLRPLRPLLPWSRARTAHIDLTRTVHGFDSLLVMSGSTASANL